MWWEIWHKFCCKFHGECDCKNVKIRQYLFVKVIYEQMYSDTVFLRHSVDYSKSICSICILVASISHDSVTQISTFLIIITTVLTLNTMLTNDFMCVTVMWSRSRWFGSQSVSPLCFDDYRQVVHNHLPPYYNLVLAKQWKLMALASRLSHLWLWLSLKYVLHLNKHISRTATKNFCIKSCHKWHHRSNSTESQQLKRR